MATIFTKIINGEIPSYTIAETADYYAFLDIRPLVKGHVLVIPKMEIDYIFELPDEVLAGLMVFAKKVSKAVEAVVACKRVGIMVIGTEVPHAHIHLVPFQSESQICIKNKPIQMTGEEMKSLANEVAKAYNEL